MRRSPNKSSFQPHKYLSMSTENYLGLLLAKCPILFRAVRYPESYMSKLAYWGIQCERGWFTIIEQAATAIEIELEYLISRIQLEMHNTEPDLKQTLKELGLTASSFYELKESGDAPLIPYCTGVREVDNRLEIGMVNGDLCDFGTWKRIRKIIDDCTELASKVCVRCGHPGTYQLGYWRRVYCDRCANGDREAPLLFLTEVISK